MKIRAKELAVGSRFWLRGHYWQVLELAPEGGAWVCRRTDGAVLLEVFKQEKVWVREPSQHERQLAPGAKVRGEHDHRWRQILGGRARVCEVCGRGDELVGKRWKHRTGPKGKA